VRDRDPEDRHDRIADELLDRPLVPLDDRPEILEVAAHARPQRLGIGRFAEGRGADEIAEENRDDLALLAHARSLGADGLQLGELNVRRHRRCERGIEAPRTDLANRRCAGGDGEPDRVVGRALLDERREVLRQ
jgi:hypothetical protein